MNSVTFGVQWDTQVVNSSAVYKTPKPIDSCHKVSQIFCSALPVTYNRAFPDRDDWKHFASAVLQAAYEATFAVAAKLSKERGNTRVMLFLTEVGGGADGACAACTGRADARPCILLFPHRVCTFPP